MKYLILPLIALLSFSCAVSKPVQETKLRVVHIQKDVIDYIVYVQNPSGCLYSGRFTQIPKDSIIIVKQGSFYGFRKIQ